MVGMHGMGCLTLTTPYISKLLKKYFKIITNLNASCVSGSLLSAQVISFDSYFYFYSTEMEDEA